MQSLHFICHIIPSDTQTWDHIPVYKISPLYHFKGNFFLSKMKNKNMWTGKWCCTVPTCCHMLTSCTHVSCQININDVIKFDWHNNALLHGNTKLHTADLCQFPAYYLIYDLLVLLVTQLVTTTLYDLTIYLFTYLCHCLIL